MDNGLPLAQPNARGRNRTCANSNEDNLSVDDLTLVRGMTVSRA